MCEIIKRKLNVEVSRNLRVFEQEAPMLCVTSKYVPGETIQNATKGKKNFQRTFHFVANLSEVVSLLRN